MSTFLLIHGALRGAWLWEKVIPLLRTNGSDVIAVDLPGHGKRSSEDRRSVAMSSYIQDVIGYIKRENLKDLILVGHSMSGMVISKVAEDMPERVKHLCYLAAVVPKDNEALIDLLPPARQDTLKAMQGVTQEIFGPIESLRTAYFTDLEGAEQEFYLRRLTPEPLRVFFDRIRLTKFPEVDVPKTYIMGMKDKSLPPDLTKGFSGRLQVEPYTIDAGHDMMVSKSEEVAEILSSIC